MESLVIYRLGASMFVVRNGVVTKLARDGRERKSPFRPDVLAQIGERYIPGKTYMPMTSYRDNGRSLHEVTR